MRVYGLCVCPPYVCVPTICALVFMICTYMMCVYDLCVSTVLMCMPEAMPVLHGRALVADVNGSLPAVLF